MAFKNKEIANAARMRTSI